MEFLSGNEAIARGAWEAGASVGVGYPGTPSTETLEAFAKMEGVYAEWCPNEKVALEVGIGASAAGARVLATMKHVGVNVAADPLFTIAYTGVNAGMLILAADDPGMHSSQNEQDSRYYAQAARIPVLEPSDSQEAYEFAKGAIELSEQFDLPVLLRSTVRISHSKSPVTVGSRETPQKKELLRDPKKWVMMPAYAKLQRQNLDKRNAAVEQWVEECEYNRIEMRDASIGIVCSGAVYQYVRDALPNASVLKLGVSWPVPKNKILEFEGMVDKLYCIDEASPFLSQQLLVAGANLSELSHPLPVAGELSQRIVAKAFGLEDESTYGTVEGLPTRPPALCAGCPHRLVFKELRRAKCIVTGDIGCYTLGALPPLAALDSTVDMGASISMAHGYELALGPEKEHPVVAVIGDSTFAHSGLTSLLNTVYNAGAGTVCILDNRTTGMTGHQGNPVNGITLQQRVSREMNLEDVVRALGVEDVFTVDPNDMQSTREAIREATEATDRLSVIVFRSPCVLLRNSFVPGKPYYVNGACTGCGSCVSLGCPAISTDQETKWASIDPSMCVGCGQCCQYCNFDAIEQIAG